MKRISSDAVPAALEEAERQRGLGRAEEAESICLDVLAVEPKNQGALRTLLLALTDQIGGGLDAGAVARERLARVTDRYQRAFLEALLVEREARALLEGAPLQAESHDGLREAMRLYEEAERLRPPGNDEALLRWNACARAIERRRGV